MSDIIAYVLRHGGDGAMIVLVGAVPLLLFIICFSMIARAQWCAEVWRSASWRSAALLAGQSGAFDATAQREAPARILVPRSRRRGTALFQGLDLLALCAAADLPLDRALIMADEALRAFDPVLARTLAAAARAASGPDAIDALEDLAADVADPGARRLIDALAMGEREATPLSATLDKLIVELRGEQAQCIEERAARLPARLAVPIITLIVPAALIVTVGPPIIRWLIALMRP